MTGYTSLSTALFPINLSSFLGKSQFISVYGFCSLGLSKCVYMCTYRLSIRVCRVSSSRMLYELYIRVSCGGMLQRGIR
jgi:hypothetical protein